MSTRTETIVLDDVGWSTLRFTDIRTGFSFQLDGRDFARQKAIARDRERMEAAKIKQARKAEKRLAAEHKRKRSRR